MTGQLIAREALSEPQCERMRAILQDNFCNVTAEQFYADLAGKNWVILICNEAGQVVGFSTLLLYQATFEGTRIAVIYSGDTIIERDSWGSAALPRTWIQSVWQLHGEQCASLPLYWLLITSGYRTYRFLSVFWREFYPCHSAPTPARMQRMLECLARDRFGGNYDRAAGVVHLRQPLRADLLPISENKRRDPHVAFFAAHNPGYVEGDELVCVAALTEENLTPAGRRMVTAGAVGRV